MLQAQYWLHVCVRPCELKVSYFKSKWTGHAHSYTQEKLLLCSRPEFVVLKVHVLSRHAYGMTHAGLSVQTLQYVSCDVYTMVILIRWVHLRMWFES